MDLLKVAAQLFMNKISANSGDLDIKSVMGSLGSLLPTNSSGDLDIMALVQNMQAGDLASLAASFLGDGKNDSFSPSQLMGLLGDSKVSSFASSLSLPKETALSGLTDMIPELIDGNSKGGSLVSSIGGSAAKKLLGSLFS